MRERVLASLRALLAVIGPLPAAVLAGIVLALFVPAPEDVRLAIGFGATVPLWVTGASLVFLDARVWRAALALAVSTAALALAVAARG
ncbi:hypothetical protein [Sandaracinus amylolyticus]|uniref:LSU ribosomal protein L25p n=1 Tax=Sandaracinus amylolyticus TaxID=927083 RepID=A0A0F6W877_9BACT|nr:hypothetical protein [Sandaracinus amylolyticus]AKF09898.1 LSU ribosomal protein L25p [Sandaracinus amylolyticus]